MSHIDEDRPWSTGPRYEYLQWYMLKGMSTVHNDAVQDHKMEEVLSDPPQDEIASLPYQERGNRHARCVCIAHNYCIYSTFY